MNVEGTSHPLADQITSAAAGHFPRVDGEWTRCEPWSAGLEAVVAFTGHAVLVLAADIQDERLGGADGYGGAHDPRLIAELAGPNGWIDSLDALLVGRGTGGDPRLVRRPDLAEHPRAKFADEIRDDVRVFGYPDPKRSAVAIIARGVAGLTELSFEVEPEHRGGAGAALIRDALSVIPKGELVVAAVAPGNAASLRSLLAADFTPIGSIQLFRRN